jgi:hypothetical protein
LHVKLLAFSWNQELKVLNDGPFLVILGLDFLKHTRIVVDVAAGRYSFAFAPSQTGSFVVPESGLEEEPYLRELQNAVSRLSTLSQESPGEMSLDSVLGRFPALFSKTLGLAACAPYEIELVDSVPLHSHPYKCAPPKVAEFRKTVDELLAQGVI